MTLPIEVLEAEVIGLLSAERSRLLDRLIASLDADPAVEDAWMQEAKRKDEEIESSAVQAIAGDVAIAKLRAALK